MRTLILAFLVALSPVGARAGLLSPQGAFVMDQAGAQRNSLSNSERIVLQQKVFNSVASPNRLSFRFFVMSPSGAQVFQHAGNAVVGSVGNAASQVSGVPVAQFYSGPGFYTYRAEAELDGQVVVQQVQFSVTSPNLLLIYPPNGARGLADNPLTFRWSASGASRYRVTVGDNPSMYNSIFSQQTSGGESFLSYPQTPTDPRQRLTAGQVYYWAVEGLDPGGSVVAKSETPYSYSVSATSMAKDLAVTELLIDGAIGQDGALTLKVRILNQGNTTENAVNLRIGVGGLPAQGTPLSVTLLNPGESREFTVQAFIPSDQKQTLATACLELFDDNVPNNCKTLSVTRPDAPSGAPTQTTQPLLSVDQMWDMLTQLLSERGMDLTGYEPDVALDAGQLAEMLDGLRQGSAQVTLTGGNPAPATETAPITGSVAERQREMPIFGNAPELPGADGGSEGGKLDADQLWTDLTQELRSRGLDLGDWEFAGDVDPQDLNSLLSGMRDGTASISVTGAPPQAVEQVEERVRGMPTFSEAPELPPGTEGGEGEPGAQAGPSVDQLWSDVTAGLRDRGIDLGGWEFAASPDPRDLADLAKGLKDKTARVWVTGSAPPKVEEAGQVQGRQREVPTFSEAPEVPAVESDEEEPKLSLDQLWSDLTTELRDKGVDLAGWEFASKPDPRDLAALAKGIRDKTAKVTVTGAPLLPPETAASLATKTTRAAPEPMLFPDDTQGTKAEPEARPEPEEEEPGEWTGMAGPQGRQTTTLAIKERDDWSKQWRRLRSGRAPRIDFKRNLVVGVVAGAAVKADRVEIEGVRISVDGLVVRYRLVNDRPDNKREPGKLKTRVPYALRQVQASPSLNVRFELVGEGGEP